MTPIPDISNAQLKIIAQASSSADTFFALVPDLEKDSPADYSAFSSTNIEIDNLVHLGLLENSSKGTNPLVETLESTYGRKVRVLKVTKVGKAMFIASKSDIIS